MRAARATRRVPLTGQNRTVPQPEDDAGPTRAGPARHPVAEDVPTGTEPAPGRGVGDEAVPPDSIPPEFPVDVENPVEVEDPPELDDQMEAAGDPGDVEGGEEPRSSPGAATDTPEGRKGGEDEPAVEPVTLRSEGRTGSRERDRDRDQVDFSAITSFLRRRGIIGPVPTPAPHSQTAATHSQTATPVLDRPDTPDEPGGRPAEPPRPTILGIARPDRATLRRYLPPVVLVAVIGWIATVHHLPGVDWGDDFALYMRQAKGLAMGNIGEVVGANRFAVENSGWSTFSPYSYPWGWPLLVAPVYALYGLNYEAIKVLEVAAFGIFLLCFFALVRRRAGVLGATLLTLLIGLSPSFVGATDTVLSDIPFLCFVGVTLWWLDRCRQRGILEESPRRLVILGLLLAYTCNIRREGISLLVALVAVHVAVIAGKALRVQADQTREALREVDWRRVALPYLTFAGAAVAFHLLLPTVLRPVSTGTGLSNIPHRFKWHQDILAEHVGLKDFGYPIQLMGSERAGRNALTLLMILAVVGMVARLLTRHQEDLALAAYLTSATLVVLVSPFQEGRYLFTITPLLVYFAYQAIPTIVELLAPASRRLIRLAVLPAAVAVGGLALLNAGDTKHAIDYRRLYKPVVNGPESPDATQMFAAVKTLTRGDDVILFFRARAMTLYTDRLAVQGSNLDQLLPRSDWYVMAKGSSYSQTPLTDDEGAARGLTKAWENTLWVIWRVPHPTA